MKKDVLKPLGASIPVIRHRVQAHLVDMLAITGELIASRGRSFLFPRCPDRSTVYDLAAARLRKAGLVAIRRAGGKPPVLSLTDAGQAKVSDVIWPERFWKRTWDGRWFVLIYDVPEVQARYRRSLQRFLRRMRMGCLQRSVWIAASDIRPLFDDLEAAAAVKDYAYLFEAQTVMGQSGIELAQRAWRFDALRAGHLKYLKACEKRIHEALPKGEVLAVMRDELLAYQLAMAEDPLLPRTLYPEDYLGPTVAQMFRSRILSLAPLLVGLSG